MSLNQIDLSPALLSALYTNVLIESGSGTEAQQHEPVVPATVTAPVADPPATAEAPRHLGNNAKKILIAVNYADALHLPDETLSFLTNMLSACKLSLGDVAIVNLHHLSPAPANQLQAHFKNTRGLLFGITPADFGLAVDFPPFQVQALAGVTFLYAPALEGIQQDRALKGQLWTALQRLFGL